VSDHPFHPWRTTTRFLEATHLDTSNPLSRGLEEVRERESTRRAGQIRTKIVLPLAGKEAIARPKKSHRRHGTFPHFRFGAPACLPTSHRDPGQAVSYARILKTRGISGLERAIKK
jgi:hypothetical protein